MSFTVNSFCHLKKTEPLSVTKAQMDTDFRKGQIEHLNKREVKTHMSGCEEESPNIPVFRLILRGAFVSLIKWCHVDDCHFSVKVLYPTPDLYNLPSWIHTVIHTWLLWSLYCKYTSVCPFTPFQLLEETWVKGTHHINYWRYYLSMMSMLSIILSSNNICVLVVSVLSIIQLQTQEINF